MTESNSKTEAPNEWKRMLFIHSFPIPERKYSGMGSFWMSMNNECYSSHSSWKFLSILHMTIPNNVRIKKEILFLLKSLNLMYFFILWIFYPACRVDSFTFWMDPFANATFFAGEKKGMTTFLYLAPLLQEPAQNMNVRMNEYSSAFGSICLHGRSSS